MSRMLTVAAAAALAMAALPARADEACTASVCGDPSFPDNQHLAPAMAMEQHADTAVLLMKQAALEAQDESVAEVEGAAHVHQLATLEDIEELFEEP